MRISDWSSDVCSSDLPRYPRLIYAAASGFGHSGPDMTRPAYDMVVQGMGGIMSVTGHPGTPPTRIGVSIGDIGSGLYPAVGLLRSEEDTSELQSLMRLPLSGFRLKQQNTTNRLKQRR